MISAPIIWPPKPYFRTYRNPPVILLLALASLPLVWADCRRLKADQDLSRTPVFMVAICVYDTLVYSIFAPWLRYSVPLRPVLYIFAAWPAAAIGNRIVEQLKKHLSQQNSRREA